MNASWLSPTQIANELNVSRNVVYRAITRGDLPAFRYGNVLRVARTDLDAFLTAHRALPSLKAGRRKATPR